MGFSDWTVHTSAGGSTVGITDTGLDAPFPIDAKSLSIDTGGSAAVALDYSASGQVAGTDYAFTSGKLRTLLIAEDIGSQNAQGLYCMASQADVTATGECYAVELNSFPTNDITLRKVTGGLDGLGGAGGGTLLATGSTLWTDATLIAVEIEWRADLTLLGGTLLIVRTGVATDFSDLAQEMIYQDTDSPLLTTFGEGIWGAVGGGPSRTQWDTTELFSRS